MKLMHPALSEPIVFTENRVPVLIVENRFLYRSMALDLIRQGEGEAGEWILSHDGFLLDCGVCLHTVYDYAHPEMIDRKTTSRFFNTIQRTAVEEMQQETHCILENIQMYLGRLATLTPHPVSFYPEDNVSALLKAFGFRPDLTDLPPHEALYEHLTLYEGMAKHVCFALLGAKAWFADEELKQLYTMAGYRKWSLLLFESQGVYDPLPAEDYILIDEDLCEVRKEGS